MDFSQLQKYMRSYAKKDTILNFDLFLYYNHINVYSSKKNVKSFTKNLYHVDSAVKLMCCVALMKQIQDKRISLYDEVSKYLSINSPNITVGDFMHCFFYADSKDETYNFTNAKKIIETCSNDTYNDYILQQIIKPLKMKSVSFSWDIDNFFTATINDYTRFCDTVFAGIVSKSRHQILSEEAMNILINDIILKNETNNKVINLKNNNEFIIIDISKKVTIVFAQRTQNISSEQFEKYTKMYELAYDGTGVNTLSKGFNLFP